MSESVAALKEAVARFRERIDHLLGDLEDDLDGLAERIEEAEKAREALAKIADIAQGGA